MKTIILSFAFALMTIVTSGQNCTPYFYYQNGSGYVDFYGSVDTMNTPIDSVSSWSWVFEGSVPATSTSQNPTGVVFITSGTYNVCLSITTFGGCSGTFCDSVIIDNCNLNLTTQQTQPSQGACDGSIIATASGGTPPYTYNWNNGQTTNQISNLCPGTYTLNLTDAGGCTESATTTLFTPVQNCQPYFSYQDSGVFTYFYGYVDSLNNPVDSVNSWSWTFQGGGTNYTSTLQNPVMQLSSNTAYTICLSITTYGGCSGTFCDSIVNGLSCPTAGQDFTNCGLEATLNATVNPGDYNTHWIVPAGITAIDINSPTTSIIASSIGTYYLIWQVTNINGSICTDTISIEFITAPNSYAGGNYWPGLFGPNSNIKTDTVCGLAYNLNALPSIGNGMWISPDPTNIWFEYTGTSSPSPIPNDTVNINYYSVFNQTYYREFIWTETYNSCTDMDTLRVYFAPVPSGQFTIQQSDCFQNIYELVAHTWPLPNNIDYNITYFDWNYFNGILDSSIISPSTSDTILVSWLTGNLYNVNLTTTNAWGCSSPLISHQINVPPIADISVTINNPTTIGSNDGYIDISILGGTPPFTYLWNTGQTTSSIYNLTSGLYLLNITDANGCNNSLVFHLYEPYDTLGGPIVDTLITGIIDTCLNFVPDSFYISQINIINNTEVVVTWVFEYQGMMQTIDVSYTFTANGNYMVTLTINCGSKALTTYSSFIHINASTGFSEVMDNIVNLFPNPANEMFSIVATPPYNYTITTMSGQVIEGAESRSERTVVNSENLPSGIYFVRISGNGLTNVSKLVINR